MEGGAHVEFAQLPLRERKAALTRLGLLDAMLEELRETSFESIKVRDLCATLRISEPTFFNYFGAKAHLLGFFVQLWSVEMAWRMARASSGRKAVDELFVGTARKMAEHNRIMPEIISWQTRLSAPPDLSPPTPAELLARFPDLEGITDLKPQPIDVLIRTALRRAIDDHSLDCQTNQKRLVVALTSLFFGAPSWLRTAKDLEAAYRNGVKQLWPVSNKFSD